MYPYWILFGVFLAGLANFSVPGRFHRYRPIFYLACLGVCLMIGLRYRVGGDWLNYEAIYQDIRFSSFGTAMGLSDPGYAFFNWLAVQLGTGIWLVNLLCAILFTAGVSRLASRQPNPWLAMLIAVPYLIIVVAMGYTRQGAAIGIICFGLASHERSLLRMTIYVIAASLMHKTAVLTLPIILVPIFRRNALFGVIGVLFFAFTFRLFLSGSSDALLNNYVEANYDSQGAAFRVTMNILAGTVLLLFRKRMGFDDFDRNYWTVSTWVAFLCVPALFLAAGSSGVDRLALFLIPLQLVALSRFPYVVGSGQRANPTVLVGVVLYSFSVELVWLLYANNAHAWLPYNIVFNGGI